jgi:hypothetical protein
LLIISDNTHLKYQITKITSSQNDNYTKEPDNDDDWLIAGPQSPKTNKRPNTSLGLSLKLKQSNNI